MSTAELLVETPAAQEHLSVHYAANPIVVGVDRAAHEGDGRIVSERKLL